MPYPEKLLFCLKLCVFVNSEQYLWGHNLNQAQIEYKHVLANISRSRYVAIATQPIHRLQIRPIVHNQGASPTTPPSYIRVRAVVWACGRRQTDRQTRVTTIHFASSTTHAKCNQHPPDQILGSRPPATRMIYAAPASLPQIPILSTVVFFAVGTSCNCKMILQLTRDTRQ